jgi:alkaline phosphatase
LYINSFAYIINNLKQIQMLKIKLLSIFTATFLLFFTATAEIKAPKNIIILIGDGMSYNTVTATNYYVNGKDSVSYQYFPTKYGCSTYNGMEKQEYRADSAWIDFEWVRTKGKYTDSAPAATALSTGKKSYDGAIGVDMKQQSLEHIMTYAKSKGKAAGVVSTVQISHATPAGFVAHNINRNNYAAIANEMFNSNFDVIIGAGHPMYNDNAVAKSSEFNYNFVGGETTWNSLKAGTLSTWTFSDDSTRVAEIAKGINVPNRLCVISRVASTLQQSRTVVNAQVPYADAMNKGVNNLSELSLAAINVLKKNTNGFVAMIEGGAIDWANHANQKGRMIEEQIDFNNAVESVIAWVENNGGWEDNLVVVTSDHECGYLLGPNANDNKPTTNPIINNGKGNVPGMAYNSGNHTNMLVPLYAKGAGAELFSLHADREDPIRGYYVDNTEVAKVCYTLIKDVPAQKEIKNVIYMVSDGWGMNQIIATNYFEGKTQQDYEKFPTAIYMTSYHGMGTRGSSDIAQYFTSYNSYKAWNDSSYIDIKPTDSAPAATAMGTGTKVYDGSINKSNQQLSLTTIAELAKQKGKAAGVVSSVQISHATPAAFGGAHNLSRNNYAEIANEMLSSNLDVVIGAGHPEFDDNGAAKTTGKDFKYVGGETTWNSLKAGTLNSWSFSDEKTRLTEIANGTNVPAKLCFIAKATNTIQQSRTGDGQVVNNSNINMSVPTLVDMTKASLNVLNKNSNGFFVMIEGGAVDWACHANQKGRLIEEQMDFNRSVDAAINWVETNSNWDETLLIVTGDHETGYLSGPNFRDLNKSLIIDNGAGNIPGMKFYSGQHTSMLIPFYAKGANADVLARMAGCYDTKREYYIENTDAAILVKSVWGQLTDNTTTNLDYSALYTNKKFIIVPNGAQTQLLANGIEGNATIDFINLSGIVTKRVNCNFSNGRATVNTSFLQKGVNFAMLRKDNQNFIAKFIVQ